MTRLLITGASGYIGGDLLKYLTPIPNLELYALVRNPEQTAKIKQLGLRPVEFNLIDGDAIEKVVENNEITIVAHLANAVDWVPVEAFLRGLASVRAKTGKATHFIHTSGAKMFSKFAGIDHRVVDTDAAKVYEIPRLPSSMPVINQGFETNRRIMELGAELGVNAYIVIPPIVYGSSDSFGNKVSIQIMDIVRIGVRLKRVYQVAEDHFEWPQCHLEDLNSLYTTLIRHLIHGEEVPKGYYFAVTGEVRWKDLYQAIANSLAKRGLVIDAALAPLDITKVSEVLPYSREAVNSVFGGDRNAVEFSHGGECALTGENGNKIGWKPKYDVKHLLSVVDEEVEYMLKEDKSLQKDLEGAN